MITVLTNCTANGSAAKTSEKFTNCGDDGMIVGGTAVDSAKVFRDVISSQKNGATITTAPMMSRVWMTTLPARPEAGDRRPPVRRVTAASGIVHPPLLHAELEQGDDQDQHEQHERDRRGVAPLRLDDPLLVEEVDDGLGALQGGTGRPHHQVDEIEGLQRVDHGDDRHEERG